MHSFVGSDLRSEPPHLQRRQSVQLILNLPSLNSSTPECRMNVAVVEQLDTDERTALIEKLARVIARTFLDELDLDRENRND
jgi:hypothetical protein